VLFSGIGILTIGPEMTRIIELDRSNDARVRSRDQEIYRQLANPVPHGTIVPTALES
jgi:hypothetical protein